MESVEASGKSIEDAILQALARLGRNRDEVEIQVLQEPSRGTREMHAREARVRVFLKPARAGRAAPGTVPDDSAPLLTADDADGADDEIGAAGNGDDYASVAYADSVGDGELDDDIEDEEEYADFDLMTTAPLRFVLPEDASIEEMAVAALRTILAHMEVRASVEVVEVDSEAETDEEPITLNIRSEDPATLSLLIGKRGETLSSLQLLVSLIVAKQTGTRERIIVDAESYRERREHNLRAMAERVAQQVRRSGHPIMLEPLPPNERRIIHMALAESGDISTESTGEGDQRRVVVSLKRGVRATS